MKNNYSLLLGVAFTLFLASCQQSEVKDEKTNSDTATYASTLDPCQADPAWFNIDPSTGKRKTTAPDEGIGSAFGDNVTVSNCDFHKWAWQKFLWLTSSNVTGNPLFIDSLIQVDVQASPVGTGNGVIVLTENTQATGDILKTSKSYSVDDQEHDVYYSIHVDSSLYNTIQKFAPMEASSYVDSTFPIGALELKISWVDVKGLRDTSDYYIANGTINGESTRIALLGMHVTGIVYNHPEFIWATFEHNELAPMYSWKTTTSTDVPVTSTTNLPFFAASDTANISNIEIGNNVSNVFTVNQYGIPSKAYDDQDTTFLKTCQGGYENLYNIQTINSEVATQLTDIWTNYFYNGGIWVNTEGFSYPLEQARLLDSLAGNLPKADSGQLIRGSVSCSNITMETYEQIGLLTPADSIHEMDLVNVANCFSCHQVSAGVTGSPLTISHIFNGAVGKKKGLTTTQSKQQSLDLVRKMMRDALAK